MNKLQVESSPNDSPLGPPSIQQGQGPTPRGGGGGAVLTQPESLNTDGGEVLRLGEAGKMGTATEHALRQLLDLLLDQALVGTPLSVAKLHEVREALGNKPRLG